MLLDDLLMMLEGNAREVLVKWVRVGTLSVRVEVELAATWKTSFVDL